MYGAEALGRVRGESDGPAEDHPFVRALEGLSAQMGDIREVKGWRHFSLKDRISFLADFLTSAEVRRTYRRKMRQLLLFFFGLLAAIGIVAAATIPAQVREGGKEASRLRARWLASHGQVEESIWAELQVIADVTGKRVLVSAERNATCLGSAVCASVAVGPR